MKPLSAKRFLPFLFLATLATPGHAEQLYVRNRPYTGVKFKDARGTRVELQSILKMLDTSVVQSPDGGWIVGKAPDAPVPQGSLFVNGEKVDLVLKDGQAFVALEDLSPLLRLRLSRNPQLNSLDVSIVKPTASVEETPSGASSPPAAVRRFENPALGISFWAPSKYILVTDPAVLKNLLARGQKLASISLPATQVQHALEGLQFMCVDPKADGGSRNDSLMMAVEQLPSVSVSNREYLSANIQSTISTFPGTKLVGKEIKKSIGGLDFLCQEYLRADPDGGRRFCRFYVTVDRQRGYFFQLAAEDKAGLNALEQLLDNLKIRPQP